MLTLSIPLPVHLPFHLLTWSPQSPFYPESSSSLFTCHHCPFPIPIGPVTKIPRNGLSLILPSYIDKSHSQIWLYVRTHMAFVKSTASYTLGLLKFWKLNQGFCSKQAPPNVSDAQPGLGTTDLEHWLLRGGIGGRCHILLETVFKICAQSPK